MENAAVGFVEVRGLVLAIHVLDAMVKSSAVKHLCTKKCLGGGLVTVLVSGDVGAVNAAVAAGKEAGSTKGEIYCADVIPRPHSDLLDYLS